MSSFCDCYFKTINSKLIVEIDFSKLSFIEEKNKNEEKILNKNFNL